MKVHQSCSRGSSIWSNGTLELSSISSGWEATWPGISSRMRDLGTSEVLTTWRSWREVEASRNTVKKDKVWINLSDNAKAQPTVKTPTTKTAPWTTSSQPRLKAVRTRQAWCRAIMGRGRRPVVRGSDRSSGPASKASRTCRAPSFRASRWCLALTRSWHHQLTPICLISMPAEPPRTETATAPWWSILQLVSKFWLLKALSILQEEVKQLYLTRLTQKVRMCYMLRSILIRAKPSSSRLSISWKRTGFSWPPMQTKSKKLKSLKPRKNSWSSSSKLNLITSRPMYYTSWQRDLRTAALSFIQRRKCFKKKVEAVKTSVLMMKKWAKRIERWKKAILAAKNNFKTSGHRKCSTTQSPSQIRIELTMRNKKLRRVVFLPNLSQLSEISIWWHRFGA